MHLQDTDFYFSQSKIYIETILKLQIKNANIPKENDKIKIKKKKKTNKHTKKSKWIKEKRANLLFPIKFPYEAKKFEFRVCIEGLLEEEKGRDERNSRISIFFLWVFYFLLDYIVSLLKYPPNLDHMYRILRVPLEIQHIWTERTTIANILRVQSRLGQN